MTRPARDPLTRLWWLPATVLGAAALTLGWARYVEPRRLELNVWEVPLDGLLPSAETSILHLSDLHCGALALSARAFLAAIGPAALACPVLCLTGDFCDRPSEVPAVEAFLAPLLHAMALQQGRAPRAFAVWGNHDRKAGQPALAAVLERLGVEVLDNASRQINGGLSIAGVGDPTTRHDRLEQALAGIPAGRPFVLLAHNPLIFPRAAAAGVPLVLAGHTHGGQVRIGRLGRVGRRGERAYRDGGWYRRGGQAMLVSRGLGTTMLPVRLGARPEAAILHLRTERALSGLH